MEHEHAIAKSFGPQAEAYLASAVHSTGEDLVLLADTVAVTENPIVLDLGCGAGHATFAVAPIAREVVAYDLTESMLAVVEGEAAERGLTNIRTELGSVEKLPFGDARFDWIVSRYSAHHWRDMRRALREARRVLKPGGRICFIDVAGGPEPMLDTHLQALELLRDPSHVRNYTAEEWLSNLRSFSFHAAVTHRWRIFLEFSSWVRRIGTPPERIAAIETLWSGAPAEVRKYYSVQDDLSFELDVIMLVAG